MAQSRRFGQSPNDTDWRAAGEEMSGGLSARSQLTGKVKTAFYHTPTAAFHPKNTCKPLRFALPVVEKLGCTQR